VCPRDRQTHTTVGCIISLAMLSSFIKYGFTYRIYYKRINDVQWLGSRVVSVLDLETEGPGSNRSRDAVW